MQLSQKQLAQLTQAIAQIITSGERVQVEYNSKTQEIKLLRIKTEKIKTLAP